VIAVYCTTKHAITTDTMDFPMLDETMERHGQVLDHETSEEGGQRAEEQRVNEQRVNEQRERYEVHHQEIQDDPRCAHLRAWTLHFRINMTKTNADAPQKSLVVGVQRIPHDRRHHGSRRLRL
jgi:hypothetical protein